MAAVHAGDEAAPEKRQAQRWGHRCHEAVRFYRLRPRSEPRIAHECASGLGNGLNGRVAGLNGPTAKTADRLPDPQRRVEDPADRNSAREAMAADRLEARRCHAAAVAAVRIPAKLTRRDVPLQI